MEVTTTQHIENKIYLIRGLQVMLDNDLAEFYQVSTGRLNEQVKRNMDRFPSDFMFQLTEAEWNNLMSQNAISNWGGRRKKPYAFTEQGVAGLSGVLKSDIAAKVHVTIMRAFINIRRHAQVFARSDQLELRQLKTEEKIELVLKAMEAGHPQPEKGIFFNGQVFDAYAFVAGLIKNAQNEIILIDNYIDESVLTLLSKRKENVNAVIYTKTIDKVLKLDLQKHNAQYPPVVVQPFSQSHVRFLLIDKTELYHIGISLKDPGKKWFAFSRMDSFVDEVLHKVNKGGNNEG
jgi:hypothetical protein